jgi:hypothetical protein
MKEPEFRKLRKRIAAAKAVQGRHALDWTRWRWLYQFGTDSPGGKRNRRFRYDTIRVNLAHSLIRSSVARLFYRDPRIYAEPRHAPETPEQELSAYLVAHLLQYLWEEIEVSEEVRRAIIDCHCFGTGIVKLGFDSEYGIDDAEVTDRIQAGLQLEQVRQQMDTIRTLAGLGPPANSNGVNQSRSRFEYHANVSQEMPWVLRVSPFDFLVDPEARTFEEARYVIHRFRRPAEDIQKDTRYRSGPRSKIKGQTIEETETTFDQSGDPRGPDRPGAPFPGATTVRSVAREAPLGTEGAVLGEGESYGLLYEVWEKDDNGRDMKVTTVSLEVDEPLREEEDPLQIGCFPFEPIVFNEVPDAFWGKSDLQDIEPQLLELNQIRQLKINWARRMCKFITVSTGGKLSEEDQQKITNATPFVHLNLDGVQGRLDEAVGHLEPHPFNPQLDVLEEQVKRDIRDLFGMSENQQGNSAEQDQTATEANIIQQNADLRMSDRQGRVERFARNIARKMLKITRRFFPPEVAIRVVGEKGEGWLPLTAEDIRREYDVKIEVGSTGKPQDEVKRQQWLQFGEMAMQVSPPQPLTVPFDWRKYLIKGLYAFGESDPASIVSWPEGMDPMQQQLAAAGGMAPGMGGGGGMIPPGAGGDGAVEGPAGSAMVPGIDQPPEAVGASNPVQPGILQQILQRQRAG